jgi:hypothetical protein
MTLVSVICLEETMTEQRRVRLFLTDMGSRSRRMYFLREVFMYSRPPN